MSFFLHDTLDAFIILTIVLRYGKTLDINVEDIVPGDSLILESDSLNIDEATLTGETFPVEKEAGVLPIETSLDKRKNSLWMGTHVISGTAKALIISTGKNTEFGKISERLKLRPSETEFEKGVRRFGYFLMEVTAILVIAIFAINVLLRRPTLDSFLFSLALAVGLTPQLLPAIININLAHGAKMMAKGNVIVKRLASIENFGSMDVLCSDKTGTLTDGTVKIQATLDVNGRQNDKVFLYAYLNACFESGFINPIDEHPYDFIRKRLSIMLSEPVNNSQEKQRHIMITKGALTNILGICTKAEIEDELEENMIFLGFITLFDPLKEKIIDTIKALKALGVSLKIITGDNKLIARNIVSQMGLEDVKILTGTEIHNMSDGALLNKAKEVSVFAEVEPNQKERIIMALKKAGNVVGYMRGCISSMFDYITFGVLIIKYKI